MTDRIKIRALLAMQPEGQSAVVMGWVRSFRSRRFLILNDGSCLATLQVVLEDGKWQEDFLSQLTVGAAVRVAGILSSSIGREQSVELQAQEITLLGASPANEYPLQPKKHSLAFLREQGHLRIRTNTFGAVFRVRSLLSFAVHQFFQERGFAYWHTPILTAADAEGAGEMFQVTALDLAHLPKTAAGHIDFTQDFFAEKASLTVSGQLEGELGAMGLGDIYTFGPTFRAENSNTSRHLAEFWMIEPEMAFCDLTQNIAVADSLIRYCVQYILTHAEADLAFLDKRKTEEEKQLPKEQRTPPLIRKLQDYLATPLRVITYTEAVQLLLKAKERKKNLFSNPVQWGSDLQSEHERFLVEKHFGQPIAIIDYPKEIKAFYMRINDDEKTVAAVDILFQGIGEMVGGSQREERMDKLVQRMRALHIAEQSLAWYLDTRRFGTCPHSGFGIGFERLVLYCTGMSNIRDVIPFPRTPRNIAF